MKRKIGLLLLLVFLLGFGNANSSIRMATTTSVYDTGLLDVLLDKFKEKTGISTQVIAVGSGQALQLGRMKEVDIIISHSPQDEEEFMSNHFGINGETFMHNYFVLAGPASDPAGVSSATDLYDALKKIVISDSLFVSRSDNSGTHKKEISLWNAAGVSVDSDKLIETGQGMGNSLMIAGERQAYILSDQSTFLSFKDKTGLVTFCGEDKALINRYSVISVIENEATRRLFDFLLSSTAKEIIDNFCKDKPCGRLFIYDYNIKEE